MSRSLKEQYLFLKLRATRDPEVYGKLYDIYVDQIYRFVYFKVGRKEEAEDLTADVFLKTWQYINEMGSEVIENLRAFLYQAARNAVIDFYRSKDQKEFIALPQEACEEEKPRVEIIDTKQDLVEKINLASDLEDVKKSLQKIRDEYREVIVLRFIEEMSVKETAEILGKSEGAVRVLLHRAVAALKEKVAQKN
ncbi:sigma-70 family RNA polymerase sigma factor [Candidatus Falkowbacteria bacterium]|nr:sigma-70 family RNA polymerase sigma factor [Candidatus Falkowbacteria bacterium]